MRYVVAHVISSPLGAVKTARLVLADVPNNTRLPEVVEALTTAGYAAQFSEGGIPFGNHEVLAEGRSGWQKGLAGIDAAKVITWSRLITPPQRNEGKRVTLRLTEAEHATFALAAERTPCAAHPGQHNESLQEWCVRVMSAAAAAQLAPALAAATVPAAPAVKRAQTSSGGAE